MTGHSESDNDLYPNHSNGHCSINNAMDMRTTTATDNTVDCCFAPLPPCDPPKRPAPPHTPPESHLAQSCFVLLDYEQTQPSEQILIDGFQLVQSSNPPPDPPPNSPPIQPRVICKDFQRGNCYRCKCKYLHDVSPFLEKKFCHDFQNKTCNRDICKFIHCTKEVEANYIKTGVLPSEICSQIPNMPACNDYLVKGKCSKGKDCPYRHITSELYKNEKNCANPPTQPVTSPNAALTQCPVPITSHIPFPETHMPPPPYNSHHQVSAVKTHMSEVAVTVPSSPMNLATTSQVQYPPPTLQTQSYQELLSIRRIDVLPPPQPPPPPPPTTPLNICIDVTKPPPTIPPFEDSSIAFQRNKHPISIPTNSSTSNPLSSMYSPASLKRPRPNESIPNNIGGYFSNQDNSETPNIKDNGVSHIYNDNSYGIKYNEHDRLEPEAKKLKIDKEKDLLAIIDEKLECFKNALKAESEFRLKDLTLKVECLYEYLPKEALNYYLTRKSLSASLNTNQLGSGLRSNSCSGTYDSSNMNTGLTTNSFGIQNSQMNDELVKIYNQQNLNLDNHSAALQMQQQNAYQEPMVQQQVLNCLHGIIQSIKNSKGQPPNVINHNMQHY